MNSFHPFLKQLFSTIRWHIISLTLFSFFINILTLAVPLYLLQLYDRVIPSQNTDTLVFLTGIVLVALVTLSVLDAIRGVTLVKFGAWFDKQISGHLLSGTIARSLRKQIPSSSSIFTDLRTVRNFFSGPTLFPILDAPWTPVFILVLYFLHPLIGLITLAGAFMLLGLALLNEYLTRSYVKRARETSSHMTDVAASIIRNSDVVESMGMRNDTIDKWLGKNETVLEAYQQAGIRSSWFERDHQVIQTHTADYSDWYCCNLDYECRTVRRCLDC